MRHADAAAEGDCPAALAFAVSKSGGRHEADRSKVSGCFNPLARSGAVDPVVLRKMIGARIAASL